MKESDVGKFIELLADYMELRGKQAPSERVAELWFRALSPYEFSDVADAFGRHVDTCKFAAQPSEIIEMLKEPDTRPDPNAAWAMAQALNDESATVVTLSEVLEAWGVAQPVMALGDEVGARMAFLDAYKRLLAERRPPKWTVTLGHDQHQRERVIRDAVSSGLIAHAHLDSLPAPVTDDGVAIAGLLTGKATPPKTDAVRSLVNRLRSELAEDEAQEAKNERDRKAAEDKRRHAETVLAQLDFYEGSK